LYAITWFVGNGGIYVGVSAGSYVAAGNFSESLGYLKAELSVHTESGSDVGTFNNETISFPVKAIMLSKII